MSKRKSSDELLTVEEAASILGYGQKVIQIRFGNGSLTKRRASNGEVRVSKAEVDALVESRKPSLPVIEGETTAEYAKRLVATWPLPSLEQRRRVTILLYGDTEPAFTGPSEYELEQRRKAQEREDALKKAQQAALAMTACDVCNLQPDQHRYRQASTVDMHEWQPGRAEKLMKMETNK